MFGYVHERWLYIMCPKNGCMTYGAFLERHHWQRINLFDPDIDLAQYTIWGHLTDPEVRHTKGVAQYLHKNPAITLDSPFVGQMLVSGVFDEHTYSLSMMLGNIMTLPIHWIPLDAHIMDCTARRPHRPILEGDDLTNDFFQEQGLDLHITLADRVHVSNGKEDHIRQQIQQLKQMYNANYQQLVKNFLEPDIFLYTQVKSKFIQKYGN